MGKFLFDTFEIINIILYSLIMHDNFYTSIFSHIQSLSVNLATLPRDIRLTNHAVPSAALFPSTVVSVGGTGFKVGGRAAQNV